MKYIKNGIIFEPHNEFVEAQMKKNGYIPYDKVVEAETDVKVEAVEVVEAPKTEEKPKKKKK